MIKLYILLLSLFLVLLTQPVSAIETDNREVAQERNILPTDIDPAFQQKLMFVRSRIAARDFANAASFLEVMYEDYNSNPQVLNLLKQCYSQLQLFFKLEELIKKQIASNPSNIGFHLSLAEVSAQQGKVDQALKQYALAESLIDGVNRVRYQLLIQSMLSHSLDSDAEKYIVGWRKLSGDNSLMADQMGLIYEHKKEYEKALTEYYPLLADTSRLGNKIEKEIVELLLFADSRPATEKFLLAQNEIEFNVRAVKILSMHYIRTNQLEKSFAFTKLRDSLSEKNGNSLISYMQTCNREELYDETIRMGEYLFTQYDKPAVRNRARFIIANAYTGSEQFEKSLATYADIFDETKSTREKTDALYMSGKLYQDYLGEIDSALIFYDSVITKYKSGMNYMNALTEIPYCYVQKSDLKTAKKLFLELEPKRLLRDQKEKVFFRLAQTLFLENNVDSCKTLLTKLLINFDNGFYVNDALSLLKIINTGSDDPKILAMYASALFYEIQSKNDSAIIALDKIVVNDSKVLSDFSLFTITRLYLADNDSLHALEAINKMETEFAESYYFPYSLKQKADILLRQNKKADEGYTIYRHLLENLPNYPFIPEIRKILRAVAEAKLKQNS